MNMVSPSALNQARNKFKHTAFIELNNTSLLPTVYEEEDNKSDLKLWKDKYILFGIDGSVITLPYHKSLIDFFNFNNNNPRNYGAGRASIFYDLLNEMIIESELESNKVGERELLFRHIEKGSSFIPKESILIMDRGYNGFPTFNKLISLNKNFVCRMPIDSNLIKSFVSSNKVDETYEMFPSKKTEEEKSIKIRLVKIELSTGEYEVIATNLLSSDFSISDFNELYKLRWKTETKYGFLKDRLDLENFSGKSLEIIKQDFYSSIFMLNLEVILVDDADRKIAKKSKNRRYNYKVAKSASYSIIKDKIWDLIVNDDIDIDKLLKDITALFMMDTIPIRKDRHYKRGKSVRRSKNYYKRVKKSVF